MNTTTTNAPPRDFQVQVITLIDDLKSVCAAYGLGNDGNEFKIITQVFLYKFLNDKFAYEVKKIEPELQTAKSWEDALRDYDTEDYKMLLQELPPDTAKLYPHHFISALFGQQKDAGFAVVFDATLKDISALNNDIFSVKTEGGAKIRLFDELSKFIADEDKRDNFCSALVNKLVEFSFEQIFNQKYDFYATIFEYLIKDYNRDSGGKYAEYYTPHAVAKIMAAILVNEPVQNVTCYDPSAGSGTLLMDLAHAIGENKCTIYSQDISQKSSALLRLNLILNNLVHSIQNIIQGDTIVSPYHQQNGRVQQFDFIVSNPPFKLDFSELIDQIDTKENHDRFFAGIPNVPKKKKSGMAIYQLFLQHIMYSLTPRGKAAIVVPTGFITAQSGIDKKIRQELVAKKMLAGVVSMPSNIFATTGTNVSILFLDKTNTDGKVVLLDASNLGKKVKDGKNQKTVLSANEEQTIIDTFNGQQAVDDLSVVVTYDQITKKNYSLSAGQYFEVKIEYVDISAAEFAEQMREHQEKLKEMFEEGKKLEEEIFNKFGKIIYD